MVLQIERVPVSNQRDELHALLAALQFIESSPSGPNINIPKLPGPTVCGLAAVSLTREASSQKGL